jgi:hypothetical protein
MGIIPTIGEPSGQYIDPYYLSCGNCKHVLKDDDYWICGSETSAGYPGMRVDFFWNCINHEKV